MCRRCIPVYRYHSPCHKYLPLKKIIITYEKEPFPLKTRFFVAFPDLYPNFVGFWALDVKIRPTMLLKAYPYTTFRFANQ
jgi:hypothetical protein